MDLKDLGQQQPGRGSVAKCSHLRTYSRPGESGEISLQVFGRGLRWCRSVQVIRIRERVAAAPMDGVARDGLLLRLHELTDQRGNLVCFGIECEVSCVKDVNLRVWYILAVAFRLAGVEGEVVLAPND